MKLHRKKWSFLTADNMLLVCSFLLVLFIFCLWDVVQCINGLCSFYGPASVTPLSFSEINSWLPLGFRVAHGNFFPVLPSIDPTASSFSFFPYISIWFHGLSIFLFGVNGAYIFGHTILPAMDFLLLHFIFRRYLNGLWSSFLAFIAIVSFSGLPFRDFLYGIFLGLPNSNITTLQQLDVSGFPFPVFSLLTFLSVFSLSIAPKKLTQKRLLVITGLWALQSQIHVFNAFVGLIFWFLFFTIRLKRENSNKQLLKTLLFQTAFAGCLLVPTILGYALVFHSGFLSLKNLGISSVEDAHVLSGLYSFLYFALPVLLTVVISALSKTDPYELIFKFSPVFILLFIEASFFIFGFITKIPLPSNLLFSRLAMVFFHFYYLVPAIYYLSYRTTTFHYKNTKKFFTLMRNFLSFLTNELSKTILPSIMLLLVLFAIFSARKSFENAKNYSFVENKRSWEELAILTHDLLPGDAVVGENALVNLLVPITTPQGTLWVNRFSNRIYQQDVIKRFALFAHIFKWDLATFLRFMSTGKMQRSENQNNAILLDDSNIFDSGVGFFLTLHKSYLSKSELKSYEEELIHIYETIQINDALRQFKVKRILSNQLLENLPADFYVSKTSMGYLYSRR